MRDRFAHGGPPGLPILIVNGFVPAPRALWLLKRRFENMGRRVRTVSFTTHALKDLESYARHIVAEAHKLMAEDKSRQFVLLGYSAGSVAALYALKRLGLAAHCPAMASMGAPYHGSKLSWPLLLTLPISRIALQLLPDSDFQRGLHHDPMPEGTTLLSVGGTYDTVFCPTWTTDLAGADHVTVPLGHLEFLWKRSVFDIVARFLR